MISPDLVIAQFYEDIAESMEEQALEEASRLDVEIAQAVSVPGVYEAFLDADALAAWLPPTGFSAGVHLQKAEMKVISDVLEYGLAR